MKRVLILVPGFLPGYKFGGPGRSIFNLTNVLNDEFEFLILTSDRDLGDKSPYPGLPVDRWISSYGAKVRYCSPEQLKPRSLVAAIRDTPHDLLYLNSFFSGRFSVAPLVARRFGFLPLVPTLLAPRGEFSSGALALKSRKKRIYIQVGASLDLFRGLQWHSSTEHEARDICAANIGGQILTASNLAAPLPDFPPSHVPRAPNGPLRVIFMSRISPKKNLLFALEVLAGMDVAVEFTVAGPQEDEDYVLRCRDLARGLPRHVKVRWAGPIAPEDVPETMAAHDLFFLPTRGENFGHVIAEALGAGTPVLISDTTPWRGLAPLGIGHELPLDRPEYFRRALSEMWYRSPSEAALMRTRAADYARQRQRDGVDVEANRKLFRKALVRDKPMGQIKNQGAQS